MRKFEPIRFNVKNEDIMEAYNLQEGVEGFYDGDKVRCVTYAIFDTEQEALSMKEAWEDSHCEIFPVAAGPDELTENNYAFICASEAYFINPSDIDENSVRYIKETSGDFSEHILYSIITKYILSLR